MANKNNLMAVILPFMHTDYTLARRVERACQEHEREVMARASWMWKMEPIGRDFDKILHDNLDDLLVKD